MGLWNKLFGGANGFRELTRETYANHAKLAPQGGDDAHIAGLYGALKMRYKLRGIPAVNDQALLIADITPFAAMKNKEQAIDSLADYLRNYSALSK